MSALRLRYVQAWVDHEGRVRRHFRKPGHPRVRLPGLPGSAEFMAAYQTALDGPIAVGAGRNRPGSVSAAVALYCSALEFAALASGTQVMRRSILERFREQHGDKPLALLPKEYIAAVLSKMKPHAARNWLGAIRALLQFAVKHGLCPQDATQAIKLPPRPKSDGYYTWNESDIAAFEAHHPIGSKARLAFALLLYTAQRRGDVIRMGRQHIRNGVLTVKQAKTGAGLQIPVHPDLKAILDATPSSGHLTLVLTDRDQPFHPSTFSNTFRQWCDQARLPKECSAHGLRKAACRRLAEAGCSANEIASISGHATLKEVERYTKAVDQACMARNAMARAARTKRHRKVSQRSDV
jgi:integrase